MNDPAEWLAGGPADRLKLASDPDAQAALTSYLDGSVLDRYLTMARAHATRSQAAHLSASPPHRLVFLPGVMGSMLHNTRRGGVSWVDARTIKRLNDLALTMDGTADSDPQSNVQSFTVDFLYDPFFAALDTHDDIDVSYFHYDWRKPLSVAAALFADHLVALCESNKQPITVVAHSMGGLVVRLALVKRPELWARIARVVFLGTPHYGSPAIAGYLKNHFTGLDLLTILGRFLSRDTFRSMWGPLSLLPAPAGIYPGTQAADDGDYEHPCLNFDPYNAVAWELDLNAPQLEALQRILDAAAEQHCLLHQSHNLLAQELRDRMIVIAGVGYRTLFRLAYRHGLARVWSSMDKETRRKPGDPNRDGDGRVPLASALLEWVGETRYARVEHGSLPTTTMVHDDVARIVLGESLQLPSTAADALSQHLGSDLQVTQGLIPEPDIAEEDDPGYLAFDADDPRLLDEMMQRATGGELLALNTARLL